MKRSSRCLALLVAMLSASCQRVPEAPYRNDAVQTVTLRIRTAANQTRALAMELAITPADQERGLMHRKSLPAGHGMLFPFPLPRTASFWMKDTPLALD